MPLVSAEWLRENLAEVVVVDCRWALGGPGAGRRAYLAGHIPGATHMDVDRDLSAAPGERGRHPLPDARAFAAAAAGAGIGQDTTVVAYDEGNGGAARLWWLLRHFGHQHANVLDGGMAAWEDPRESGPATAPAPARPFVPRERAGDTAGAQELLAAGEAIDLVDARAPERFRGEREPVDPVAGHSPGARNVPFAQPPYDLGSGERPLVAYCGSGITAAIIALHAEAAGRPARLYPGGWSEWCALGLPVATGE